MRRSIIGTVLALGAAGMSASASGQPWKAIESPLLVGHVQLTFPEQFFKAGEAYFDPTGEWIIFQAIPTPAEGVEPDEHYSMYVAPLERDAGGGVTGLGEATLVSTPGSGNTCGWFHPTEPGVVLFGSTIDPPTTEDVPGYQKDKSTYLWSFPPGMDVVSTVVPAMAGGSGAVAQAKALFTRPGYDAESSWSADGRFILYANVDAAKSAAQGRPDADIFVYDTETEEHHPLVVAPGYDGGPFFSPDGKSICYRSDRAGNDLLQLYVSELKFDEHGVPIGVAAEHEITRNRWVNWAPFFHPSGKFLIFTGSGPYHEYDVYAIELDKGFEKEPAERIMRRVTFAGGFDGLPVFNADGSLMMWTSQRTSTSKVVKSQLWIARVDADADWIGPLSESQAIAIAHAAIAEDPNRIVGEARLQGENWHYEATVMGGNHAGPVSVIVRPDGTSELIQGDGS